MSLLQRIVAAMGLRRADATEPPPTSARKLIDSVRGSGAATAPATRDPSRRRQLSARVPRPLRRRGK